jgi:hypothetical protein
MKKTEKKYTAVKNRAKTKPIKKVKKEYGKSKKG